MSKVVNTDLTEVQKKALRDWLKTEYTDLSLMLNGFFECVKTHQIEFGDSGDNLHLEREMRETIQKIRNELKELLNIGDKGSIVVKSNLIQFFDANLCFDYKRIFPLIAKTEIQFIHCNFSSTKEDLPIGWEGSGRVFEKRLFFHDCTFGEFISFSSSIFKEVVEFNNSTFMNSCDFHECTFEKNACFYGVDFKGVPNFSQANFLQKINLVNTNLNFSFEECQELVKKERRDDRRVNTLKMGKPITGAQIANDFRDSFRLFKGNLIDEHNQLDAANYRKIELYFKEIEMEENMENKKSKKFGWKIIKEKTLWLYNKLSELIFPKELPEYIEYGLLKFYRKISDHHLRLFDIVNIFVFFVAFHSLFVFGITKTLENYLLLGTKEEINYIVYTVLGSIVGICLIIVFYLLSQRKQIYIDILKRFIVGFLIFGFFLYLLMAKITSIDFRNQVVLHIVLFGLVALYCLIFFVLYLISKCTFLKNILYFFSYILFMIFFVLRPHIVAPVLGIFQEQKMDNVVLEKYIQTTKFSELEIIVKRCEALDRQIDWTHDRFQQVRQVLLKHSDEFLLGGECPKQEKNQDPMIYEDEVKKVSIMALKNTILNKALKAINMIYFIGIVLLLFSLVKTARKNSIVPS